MWHSDYELMLNQQLDGQDSFVFWKNLLLMTAFFVLTPVTIATSLFSLFAFREPVTAPKKAVVVSTNLLSRSGVSVYASLPANSPSVSEAVEAGDARVEIVKNYLTRYESVLTPYAPYIVQTADRHGLDFRLIPAIAQQESNLCKFIPPGGHNCWGWGIHSAGTLGFNSFEEAIETVSAGIKKEYIDKGYRTPEEIMSKYTPSSNGSWARGVNQFMSEME